MNLKGPIPILPTEMKLFFPSIYRPDSLGIRLENFQFLPNDPTKYSFEKRKIYTCSPYFCISFLNILFSFEYTSIVLKK